MSNSSIQIQYLEYVNNVNYFKSYTTHIQFSNHKFV